VSSSLSFTCCDEPFEQVVLRNSHDVHIILALRKFLLCLYISTYGTHIKKVIILNGILCGLRETERDCLRVVGVAVNTKQKQ
jgi:hypothetical protein